MQYCAWPNYVNRRIIDSTNVTVGDGAVQSDSIEGSPKSKRRVLCANPPDKFQVTMHFNCYKIMEVDADGNELPKGHVLKETTEKDRFFLWLKGVHRYGVNPFIFPAILWNSNSKTSFSEEEVARGKLPKLEYYQITSAVEGSKHGDDVEVTMTWETYSTGMYEIPVEALPELASITGHDGYAIVTLTTTPINNLETTAFEVKLDNKTVASEVYTNEDASRTLYVIYPKISDDSEHTVVIIPNSQKVTSDQTSYTFRITRGK